MWEEHEGYLNRRKDKIIKQMAYCEW